MLPGVSTTVAPARSDISRCSDGGIIRSSVVTRYQLGLVRQAGSLIVPPAASRPHGTCESAMNFATSSSTSPANAWGNLPRSSKRKPSCGGRRGGAGLGGGLRDGCLPIPARARLEARGEDQSLRLGAGPRLGDNRAAVGVADENHRLGLRVDHTSGGVDV